MHTVLTSEFKRGLVLMLDGMPQIIEEFHTSGTAQTRHKLHVRLRQLKSGRFSERVFSDNERILVADLQYRRVQFSYQQAGQYVFLDVETFDEWTLPAEIIGDRHWFLKENEEYKAMLLEGKLLDILLPPSVPLMVVETAPPQSGGSDSAWKPARLETGLEITLPLFIAKDETVRVDTATRKYAGR